MRKPSHVQSLPTRADGKQCWRCDVCGAELCYDQPIALKAMLTALGGFLEEHEHGAEAGKEAPNA